MENILFLASETVANQYDMVVEFDESIETVGFIAQGNDGKYIGFVSRQFMGSKHYENFSCEEKTFLKAKKKVIDRFKSREQ